MVLTLTPLADETIEIMLTGLQPGEIPHLLLTQDKPDGVYQMEEWGMSLVGTNGRSTHTLSLSSPHPYPHWQGKVLHARLYHLALPSGDRVKRPFTRPVPQPLPPVAPQGQRP